ncbi:MAG: sugar transferase, partial [Actinomycetota bacterium]
MATPPADGRTGVAAAYRRVATWIALSDSAALLSAFALAYLIRFGIQPPPLDFVLVMAVVPPAWIAICAGWHLFGVHRFAPAEEFRRLVSAITVCVTLVVTISFWSKESFSRAWVGLSWILSLVLVLAARQAWHRWMGRRRADGKLTFRTLIVGTNEEAERLARVLRSQPVGFAPLGYVSNGNGDPHFDGVSVVGDLAELRDTIHSSAADCVLVASTAVTAEEMRFVAKAVRQEGVELRVSANLPQTLSTRIALQPLAGVMTLALSPVRLTGAQAALKRAADIVGSSLGLILLAPVFLTTAVAIAVMSKGPILFRQERIGRRGRPFTLLKFRTMVVRAEEMVEELLDLNEAKGPMFKIREDPRVTRVGRFLRTWSLDELPQLINV